MRRQLTMSALFLVSVLLWPTSPSAGSPTGPTAELPSGYELRAITAGVSGEVFVVAFHPFDPDSGPAQGSYVFEVSAAGAIRQLPVAALESVAGTAGISAAGQGSFWVPLPHGVILVGQSGAEKTVSIGGAEISGIAPDRRGGVWVGAGAKVLHVTAAGRVSALRIKALRPPGNAGIAGLATDRAGALGLAVVRGGEQLLTEVLTKSPGSAIRSIKVRSKFFYPEEFAVSRKGFLLRSGREFLRLSKAPESRETASFPRGSCVLTEVSEVWCQRHDSVIRVGSRKRVIVSLGEPGFRVRGLTKGKDGSLWYGAEDRYPCKAGPSTCVVETPGTVLIGRLR